MEGGRPDGIIRISKKAPFPPSSRSQRPGAVSFGRMRREFVYASGIKVCSLMSPLDRSYWPTIVIVAGSDRLPASSTAMTV
jgi:hypothetical protein